MIDLLIPLVVLGVVVWAVARAAKRRADVVTEPSSAASTRRLFQYGIMYVAFVVAASGLGGLLGSLIAEPAAREGAELAGPLAMTIVGVPTFVALAGWAWRTHAADGTERNGLGWALYLNVALVTALGVAVGSAFAFARDAVEGSWRSASPGVLVAWVAGWAVHWYAWRRLAPGLLPRLHLWVGSIAGLAITAVSTGLVLNAVGERSLDAVAAGVTAATTGDELALAIIGVVIGAVVWSWHWLFHGLRTERSDGWYVTVLLFGVLGGLVAAVAGTGYGIYLVLEWLLGEPGTTSAVGHFQELSASLATVLVGLGVWQYHRAIIGPKTLRERTEIDRVYDYLVTAVGLVTVAVSVVLLVVAFFEAIAPTVAGSDANTILAAVTLLVVGGPVWVLSWLRLQRLVAAHRTAEVGSPVRRTYLLSVFGVGGVVAFGALITLLVVLFEAVLDERTGSVARDVAVPVALLVTTGIGAAYHWLVYRAERSLAPRPPRRDVLLVGDGPGIAAQVAERAHVRVRALHRLDLAAEPACDVDAIVAAIDRAEGEHLLVLAGNGEVRVVPYE